MPLITVTDLENYSGVVGDALAQSYVTSACEIVRNYLGYNPEEIEYDSVFDGTGCSTLFLEAQHITEIRAVSIGGAEVPVSQFYTKENALMFKNGDFPLGMQNVTVRYVAGWDSTSMPEVIRTTALQIASLRQMESGENIGVSSKSFGDSGSRVFLNTRNYVPLLKNISNYKLF